MDDGSSNRSISDDPATLLHLLLNLSSFDVLSNDISRTEAERVISGLELYLTPVIIVVGILGNALSLAVFSLTHLRRISSSLFLATLSVADILFLASLAFVWLEKVDVLLYTSVGWCPAVMYVSRVSGCVAAWSVVSFTAERYVTVHFPLLKDVICTRRRAAWAAVLMVATSFVFYSYVAWSYRVIEMSGPARPLCGPKVHDHYFVSAMIGADTLLSCLVPTIVIVVLNASIICKIRKYQQQQTHTVSIRYWSHPAARSLAMYEPNRYNGASRVSTEGQGLRVRFGARPDCHRNYNSENGRFHEQEMNQKDLRGKPTFISKRTIPSYSNHGSVHTDAEDRTNHISRSHRSNPGYKFGHQRCYHAGRHFSYHGVENAERSMDSRSDHLPRQAYRNVNNTNYSGQTEPSEKEGFRRTILLSGEADLRTRNNDVGCLYRMTRKRRSIKIRSHLDSEYRACLNRKASAVDKVNNSQMPAMSKSVARNLTAEIDGKDLRWTSYASKASKMFKRSSSDNARCEIGDDRLRKVLKNRNQYRTAKMLLTLSTLTVLLNLPTYLFRIQSVICDVIGFCLHFYLLSRVSQLIYFLNFAINFFVYNACARQFRVELRRLCSKTRVKFVKFFVLVHRNVKSSCIKKTGF